MANVGNERRFILNYTLGFRLGLSWSRGGVGQFWHKAMSPFKEIETGSPANPSQQRKLVLWNNIPQMVSSLSV